MILSSYWECRPCFILEQSDSWSNLHFFTQAHLLVVTLTLQGPNAHFVRLCPWQKPLTWLKQPEVTCRAWAWVSLLPASLELPQTHPDLFCPISIRGQVSSCAIRNHLLRFSVGLDAPSSMAPSRMALITPDIASPGLIRTHLASWAYFYLDQWKITRQNSIRGLGQLSCNQELATKFQYGPAVLVAWYVFPWLQGPRTWHCMASHDLTWSFCCHVNYFTLFL